MCNIIMYSVKHKLKIATSQVVFFMLVTVRDMDMVWIRLKTIFIIADEEPIMVMSSISYSMHISEIPQICYLM